MTQDIRSNLSLQIDENMLHISSETGSKEVVVPISENDHSMMFFFPMLVYDREQRKLSLNAIIRTLRGALKEGNEDFIGSHIANMVRFAEDCPFEDIRWEFKCFLEELNSVKGFNVIIPQNIYPSYFFPPESFFPMSAVQEPNETIFKESFIYSGRVSHLDQILGWHPSIYERFSKAYQYTMRAYCPLPFSYRNYIAIIAISVYNCDYLYRLQSEEFLLNDGDPSWLESISNAPQKFQNLLEINSILAYQPWKLTVDHITKLIGNNTNDFWTVGELVHILIIFSTFRTMATLVFGLGITPEIDSNNYDPQKYVYTTDVDSNLSESFTPTENLINKLRNDVWDEENVKQQSVKEFEESENIHFSTEIKKNR